ncbi:aminoglycoside phosphotransferase family protein [Leifsonia sp. F6_8S_P_1B]|uniref:Aminoglycoside phosphotransferase family protein n=1 Tax=Leifsonia williamsii TaxID=3035919 RepID=A0ABT8K9Y7_9MICO|nr:aminoglycoside phosphotransferase family protein [Leifsonia williamsii]MDN4614270.1 aminoglycoside phosphotransferase family protein [Leifsonia williamsii]
MSTAIDDLLAPARERWHLAPDGDAFATATSVLQPVVWQGCKAFLKLATEDEERAGGRVLRWWRGRGAAPVLAAEGDALLLERATGERDLARLAASGPEGDDEATRILCRVGRRLHASDRPARPAGLADLPRWFRELPLHAAEAPEAHGGLYPRAAAEAAALLAHPSGDVVLHADLHHGNVLDFGERGWLAIDPKPVHGDPGFDVANILCNPGPEVALRPGRLERTAGVIAAETGMDERLVLRWALAWAGLSAAWSERSGGDATVAVGVGRRARALLDA